MEGAAAKAESAAAVEADAECAVDAEKVTVDLLFAGVARLLSAAVAAAIPGGGSLSSGTCRG